MGEKRHSITIQINTLLGVMQQLLAGCKPMHKVVTILPLHTCMWQLHHHKCNSRRANKQTCKLPAYLHASRVRPPATHAALKASATAVELVTNFWESATRCISTKQRLQMAQGVGPQAPSCSQASTPVVSSHTQRLVVVVNVHMRSVELQSGVVLQEPGARGVLGATTRPPGMMRPVLVPCAVHRLRLPRGT